MDSEKLVAQALAFPILAPILAATVTPAVAQACSTYDCSRYEHWVDLAVVNVAKIPSDGVIVLQGTHFGEDLASLPAIELTVTQDGQPIAGALEASSMHGVLVWRPAAPWQTDAAYAVAGMVTNPEEGAGCGQPTIPIEAMVNIDVAPGVALVPVEFSGVAQVEISPVASLDLLVCCEGTAPSSGYGCGGPDLYWDAEECAPTLGHGYLTVEISGQAAAAGPTAEQIVYTLKVDGKVETSNRVPQFSVSRDAPFCAVIEASYLASGAVTASEEQCFGQDMVKMLGPQVLDLAATLQCVLEQCATADNTWDPMMCVPYDPSQPTGSDGGDSASDGSGSGSATAGEGDGDKGCACAVRPTGDAGLLALVGLVGLARRRRARG